jgi:hypothetical protein
MFRVSRHDLIGHADTIDGVREIVRGQLVGPDDLNEIRADPFPSGHTSRAWVG